MLALPGAWKDFLAEETATAGFLSLESFLAGERARNTVFPPEDQVFRAFSYFSPLETRAVIIGQDPYHERGQAEGLCFSVPAGAAVPPSLRNIRKELALEYGREPGETSLEPWARQGVLLLNAVLTVREGTAASHAGRGWEEFTSAVLERLSRTREGLVFLLWGNYARKAARGIRREGHLVLEAAHPSPLSQKGFFGCNHFRQAEEWWRQRGEEPVRWL